MLEKSRRETGGRGRPSRRVAVGDRASCPRSRDLRWTRNASSVFLDHTAVVPWDMILEKMGMETFLYAAVQLLEYTQAVYQAASRNTASPSRRA